MTPISNLSRWREKPFRSRYSNVQTVTIRRMAIVKDTRAAVLRIEAERALQQNHWIFTPTLTTTTNPDMSGSISGWGRGDRSGRGCGLAALPLVGVAGYPREPAGLPAFSPARVGQPHHSGRVGLVTGAKLNCHGSSMRKPGGSKSGAPRASAIRERPRDGLTETLTRSPVRCVQPYGGR